MWQPDNMQETAKTDKKTKVLLPGEPIENPLPGPKKHIKKTMDYAFQPSEDQMHYDLEVPDDDDYGKPFVR